MARLQILELPEGTGDDRPPFVLVVDQCAPQRYVIGLDSSWQDHWQQLADKIGARGVIVTPETIDIPANDTTAYLNTAADSPLPADAHYETVIDGTPTEWTRVDELRARTAEGLRLAHERTDIARDMDRLAKWKNELTNALGIDQGSSWDDIRNTAAEFRTELIRSENAREHLRQDRDEARSWARHGYEIGQRHCGWTDHGVAPGWLTEGWPPHIESCEHLKHAADLEKAEAVRKRVAKEQKAVLTDALGMDRLRDWDDIVNAARGLRKERDTRTAIVQRIRDFPNAPESADSPAGTAPEYLAGYRDAVDAVRRATYSADAHTDA
jgi:hypothetical protein